MYTKERCRLHLCYWIAYAAMLLSADGEEGYTCYLLPDRETQLMDLLLGLVVCLALREVSWAVVS